MASKLDFDRSQDSSWFSDYYYGKLAYHDINLRSYFGAMRPPNRFNLGFRLGRSIILHSPKKTSVHLFVPRRPPKRGRGGFRGGDQGGAKKGQMWAVSKVTPIGCLREGKGKVAEAALDQEKEEGRKRKQSSQSIKKNLADLLQVSRAHPRNVEISKDMAFMVDDVATFRRTKLSNFLFPGSDKARTDLLKKTLPTVNPSMKYFVMQYMLKANNNMPFDPVAVLGHMVAKGANAEGSGFDQQRMKSQIGFFLESLTKSDEEVSSAKKKLSHSIQQASDLQLAGTRKKTTAMSLIPFYGATFPFLRDGVNKKSLVDDSAREKVLDLLRVKCWNLIGSTDKGMDMVEKLTREGGVENLSKGIEMISEIILKNRRIPYGFNSYLNEVMKMQSLVSNSTNTITSINSVKIRSFYQSAALIAEEISVQLRTKKSFRAIFSQIVRELPSAKGVEGIRVTCSGRLGGAEIAKTESGKFGKTSTATFDQKVDYAFTEAATRYGIIGVKVWISYKSKKKSEDKKEARAGEYGLLT